MRCAPRWDCHLSSESEEGLLEFGSLRSAALVTLDPRFASRKKRRVTRDGTSPRRSRPFTRHRDAATDLLSNEVLTGADFGTKLLLCRAKRLTRTSRPSTSPSDQRWEHYVRPSWRLFPTRNRSSLTACPLSEWRAK